MTSRASPTTPKNGTVYSIYTSFQIKFICEVSRWGWRMLLLLPPPFHYGDPILNVIHSGCRVIPHGRLSPSVQHLSLSIPLFIQDSTTVRNCDGVVGKSPPDDEWISADKRIYRQLRFWRCKKKKQRESALAKSE